MTNTTWIAQFCNDYGPLMVWLAKLFIYVGLIAGAFMAAAEVYKLYREARAIKPPGDADDARVAAAAAPVGEIIKSLVGLLTGAKAWLALTILGVLLLWLAGNAIPEICTPPAAPNAVRPGTQQPTVVPPAQPPGNGQ